MGDQVMESMLRPGCGGSDIGVVPFLFFLTNGQPCRRGTPGM